MRAWRSELSVPGALVLGGPMLLTFAGLVFYPLVKLVATSFENGVGDYRELGDGTELRAIVTTLWVSGLVMGITLVLGAVIAWSLRSRKLATVFLISILASISMSVVVKNYAFITILGKFGLVNTVMGWLGLGPRDILFTSTAVTVGMVYSLLPLAVFPLYFSFRAVSDDQLHAAQSLGASWWQMIRTIVLPQALPGFFITAVLVFIFSIGFFVTPVVLGGPTSTFLATMIQQDISRAFDQPAAASKSVFLIVAALVLLTVAIRIVGRHRFEKALG